jgi:ribosome-binding protein aMBF1 (putative translation factor)
MQREHLKEARRAAGLTAVALSEKTEIKEEKIYQVERGRYLPHREEAARWAAALGMRPAVAFPEFFSKGGAR